MNAERLHAIAKAVKHDLDTTNAVEIVKQLTNALQQVVNAPQQAQHQQQVSQHRQNLDQKLQQAPSNDFSPAWKQTLNELGASGLLGEDLRARVEEIFSRNQITPETARRELQSIQQSLQRLGQAVEELLSAFQFLDVGSEDLEPGECELGVLVPRRAVDNELRLLGAELETIQRMFAPFSEMATGSRNDFEIRAISSTDFSVFLNLTPQEAACVAFGVERAIKLYKNLLEIRHLRGKLREQDVPEEALGGIDSHANEYMEHGLEGVADEVAEGFGEQRETGRRNELRNEVRFALNQIANRIDQGYNIDVRARAPEPEEEAAPDEARDKAFETIEAVADELRFMKLSGSPILQLPEPEEPESEENEDDHEEGSSGEVR